MWTDLIQKSYNLQDDFEDKEDQKVTNKRNLYPMIDNVDPYELTTKIIREAYDRHAKHVKPCCGVLD